MSFFRIPGAGTDRSAPHCPPVNRSGLASSPAAEDIETSDIRATVKTTNMIIHLLFITLPPYVALAIKYEFER
jgi:hypothetical protein